MCALDQASYELQGTKPLHYYDAGLLHMCIGVCVSAVCALDQASYELQGTKPLHYYHAGLLYMCIGVCVSTEDF